MSSRECYGMGKTAQGILETIVQKDRSERRNNEQNKRMWAMLHDISAQVTWKTAQGEDVKPSAEDWKDIVTAYVKGQRMYVGIDGGIVMVGERTSKMTVGELTEVIEALFWFGAEKRVIWSDPQMIDMMGVMRDEKTM